MKSDGVAPVDSPTATAGTITNQVRGRATVQDHGRRERARNRRRRRVRRHAQPRVVRLRLRRARRQQQQLELRLRNLTPGQEVLLPNHGDERGRARRPARCARSSRSAVTRGRQSSRRSPAQGTPGRSSRLYYTIFDNVSERTSEKLTVYRLDGPAIAVLRTNLSRSAPGHAVLVQLARERPPGLYRFCVVGYDTNGNASAPSCAPRPHQVASFEAALDSRESLLAAEQLDRLEEPRRHLVSR